MKRKARLVVVSNRLPALPGPGGDHGRHRPVGGLVNALQASLGGRASLWLGWSGRTTRRKRTGIPPIVSMGSTLLATLDLPQSDYRLFYHVFANQTLWPLLHSLLNRVVIRQDAYRSYRRVNRAFAAALVPLLQEGDLVWVHDYHLIPLGLELRRLGWRGKTGFFLHTPFASADIFGILPWEHELLETLFDYQLVGVHTTRFAHNLFDTMLTEFGGSVSNSVFSQNGRSLRAGVYPIGIDPERFAEWADVDEHQAASQMLLKISPAQRVIIGVDRLDYTKGVPGRLLAFESLLNNYPSLREVASLVQISAPSRSTVPEYIQEKAQLDLLVGRINGRFSEAGWLPVQYLYRPFTQQQLAALYRRSDVCLVTPLRDGMNLVAKEFVASQSEDDPGVLVLSEFCGAAETMRDALIVNPYDIEGTAKALYRALTMPLKERRARWESLLRSVRTHTARAWCDSFLDDLERA